MATAIQLIGTGIAMGIVHVLTGPDHISALATLSSSSSSADENTRVSKCYLFGLGARWGIGHSTGLLLVGGIFILKDIIQNNDDSSGDGSNSNSNSSDESSDRLEIPESVTRLFESFVGIFMLALGFYGIYEARRIKNGYAAIDRITAVDDDDDDDDDGDGDETDVAGIFGGYSDNEGGYKDEEGESKPNKIVPFELEAATTCDNESEDGSNDNRPQDLHDDCEEFRYNVQLMLGTVSSENDGGNNEGSDSNNHHHHHHHDHSNSPFLALCAGIFHGLAGPGGVLGVVPAIQLHNAGLAACYLLSFCASSTITMGTFASAYGTFTAFLARCCSRNSSNSVQVHNEDDDASEASKGIPSVAIVEFWIRSFSASLSVLVGVAWLVLLAMGKLEDVFG